MADATSVTCKQLTNVGNEMLFELKGTATNGEFIIIPTTGPGSQVIASKGTVKVISANNVTSGTRPTSVVYTPASRKFTYVESGITDEDIRIEFRYEP